MTAGTAATGSARRAELARKHIATRGNVVQYRRAREAHYTALAERGYSGRSITDRSGCTTTENLGKIGAYFEAAVMLDIANGDTAYMDDETIVIRRSWSHIMRGLGKSKKGSVKADRAAYLRGLKNLFGYSVQMGWISGWEAELEPSGEGRGILIRVRRDSSVGRAIFAALAAQDAPQGPLPGVQRPVAGRPSAARVLSQGPPRPLDRPPGGASVRSARPPASLSFSSESPPPSGEGCCSDDLSKSTIRAVHADAGGAVTGRPAAAPRPGSSKRDGTRVGQPSGVAVVAPRPASVRAELHLRERRAARAWAVLSARPPGGLREVQELFAAHPWMLEVRPVDMARAAWRLHAADSDAGLDSIELRPGPRETPGRPVISREWQQHLDTAVRQLDRYANSGQGQPGYGLATIFVVCSGEWREWMKSAPYSLGGIAVCMRRQARAWQSGHRARRPEASVRRRARRRARREAGGADA